MSVSRDPECGDASLSCLHSWNCEEAEVTHVPGRARFTDEAKLAVNAKNPSSQQEEKLSLEGSGEATAVTSFALTLPLCGLEDMMAASEQPTSPLLCKGSCEATTVMLFALTLPLCDLEDTRTASEEPTSPLLCT